MRLWLTLEFRWIRALVSLEGRGSVLEHMLEAEPRFPFSGFNSFHSGSSGAGQFPPTQVMSGQEQVQDLGVRIIKKGDIIVILYNNLCLCFIIHFKLIFFSFLSDPYLFLQSSWIIRKFEFWHEEFWNNASNLWSGQEMRFLNLWSGCPKYRTFNTHTLLAFSRACDSTIPLGLA